jgi:glycerophosphoryl diester phosphodiesterase
MSRADHLPPLKRVGHKGADLIAAGNTLASFEAALDMGVHMIEFDILPAVDGRLVLAHDPVDAAGRECVTLEEGLDHFASDAYAGVELDVDLKAPGYEREVAEALAQRGLVERSLVSSTYLKSLDVIGEVVPGLRRGWSVPRARRDYTKSVLAPAVYGLLMVGRKRLPSHSARLLRAGRIEAVMTHFLLASAPLVRAVHAEGGQVYVWTVDDQAEIERFEAMGMDGVITNDPRLFDGPVPAATLSGS